MAGGLRGAARDAGRERSVQAVTERSLSWSLQSRGCGAESAALASRMRLRSLRVRRVRAILRGRTSRAAKIRTRAYGTPAARAKIARASCTATVRRATARVLRARHARLYGTVQYDSAQRPMPSHQGRGGPPWSRRSAPGKSSLTARGGGTLRAPRAAFRKHYQFSAYS